jgi:hypothetical protein
MAIVTVEASGHKILLIVFASRWGKQGEACVKTHGIAVASHHRYPPVQPNGIASDKVVQVVKLQDAVISDLQVSAARKRRTIMPHGLVIAGYDGRAAATMENLRPEIRRIKVAGMTGHGTLPHGTEQSLLAAGYMRFGTRHGGERESMSHQQRGQ